MRRRIAVAMALLAVGCSQKARETGTEANVASNEPTQQAAAENQASPAANPANQIANGGSAAVSTGVLPPANAAVRYLGTWASSKANCTSKPWRFTRDSLDVANGPHCSFYNVAKVPGGYDVAAQCPTKQPVHTDLIKLRFAESAQAMLVESNAISPTGLIYCGK